MGSDTLIPRSFGQKIVADWFNLFKRVLAEDIVSRNTTGATKHLYGSLGNSSYRWNQAHLIEKRLISGSNYVALKAPTLSANVDFKWPQALPDTDPGLLSFDTAGSGQVLSPDSTLDLSGSTLKLANGSIGLSLMDSLGSQLSSESVNQTLSSATQDFTLIPNHSLSITTTGRPVFVGLTNIGPSNPSLLQSTTGGEFFIRFKRGSTELSRQSGHALMLAPNIFFHIDTPPAGTYTYTAEGLGPFVSGSPTGSYKMTCSSCLLVFEYL